MLLQGWMLGGALDAALAIDPEFDFGAHLQQGLQYGIFAGIEASEYIKA